MEEGRGSGRGKGVLGGGGGRGGTEGAMTGVFAAKGREVFVWFVLREMVWFRD